MYALYLVGFIDILYLERYTVSMTYTITIPTHLGTVLRTQRKKLHLSQIQAAEKSGLLQKTISLIEREPERASVESLFKLINALGLSLTLFPRNEDLEETRQDSDHLTKSMEIW
ncbi:MAG: helix-turn-helix domain-containing protein [Spirochaetaceae bacterium]|nr:helix-turn-helix domain-containing protein [Spirochaetaceae bacterium]